MSADPSSTTRIKSKRVMDIEQALSWAFREELPKAKADRAITAPPTMSVHPMWRAGAFGGRIDNWNNHDPGFPLAMGEPHPDALLIGNAVKGCDVEKLYLWDFLIPFRIGEQYDQAGLIEKAKGEAVAVMTTCATSRSRPDCADFVAVEPVRSVTGQITVWVREPKTYMDANDEPIVVEHDLPTKPIRKGVYPAGAFCKLRYVPGAATVALERVRYAAWWAGLTQVAEHLRVMGLASIEISGLTAPRMPWVDPPEAVVPPKTVESRLPPLEERLIGDRMETVAVAATDDVGAYTQRIRDEVLKGRRGFGRRQRPRRHSEVRYVYNRDRDEGAETA